VKLTDWEFRVISVTALRYVTFALRRNGYGVTLRYGYPIKGTRTVTAVT
jgi:hypothetical protein